MKGWFLAFALAPLILWLQPFGDAFVHFAFGYSVASLIGWLTRRRSTRGSLSPESYKK